MPEKHKSPGNIIGVAAIKITLVLVVSMFFLACSQNELGSVAGYWTPGNNCEQRFFELTNDSKLYQWKWDKRWNGYNRDTEIKPSDYGLFEKNIISISGIDKKNRKQNFTGEIIRVSNTKLKITDIYATRDGQPVKNAPAEITLTKCGKHISEQIKNK